MYIDVASTEVQGKVLWQVQVQAEQGYTRVQPTAGRVAGTQRSSAVSDAVSCLQCGAQRGCRRLRDTLGPQQTVLRAVAAKHQSTGLYNLAIHSVAILTKKLVY